MVISCGAALFNLRLGAVGAGLSPEVAVFPDPGRRDLLATVTLRRPVAAYEVDQQLLVALRHRHTTRTPMLADSLPPRLVAQLEDAARAEGAALRMLDVAEVEAALGLAAQAEAALRADLSVRSETARWIHQAPGRWDDGVPASALGVVDQRPHPAVRDLAMGAPIAGRRAKASEPRPDLALVSTDGDSPADWLRAGQAVQHAVLAATAHGLVVSFLNQALAIPDTRQALRAHATTGGFPQMLLRLGYGLPTAPTPRRPLEDVVLG